MLLANVIFPAPSAAYISSLFFSLATILAMLAEILVFYHMQGKALSFSKIAQVVLSLNLLSWLLGLVFTSLLLPSALVSLPTEQGPRILQPGPYWSITAIASFPLACLVSILLEYLGLRLIFSKLPLRHPLRSVVLANLASYVVLALVLAVFLPIVR